MATAFRARLLRRRGAQDLLYRMIAYRLQAERLGDLVRDTQRFLARVAAGTRNGDERPEGGDHPRRHGLQPGTIPGAGVG